MPDALQELLARYESERLHWISLEGDTSDRAVQIKRPTDVFMVSMSGQSGRAFLAACASELVIGWRGFTLRDIGGGSDDPLPFSQRAWGLLWPDHVGWAVSLSEGVSAIYKQHTQDREDAAKN